MKKLYILSLFSICTFFVKAQYTLTSAIFPIAGDIEKSWTADTAGVAIGTAGTNQIWNYTGITISPTVAVSSQSYVAVNTAPNYTAYPSANLASTSDGMNYTMSNYGSSLTNYGRTSSTLSIIYGNPQTLLNVPFTYGTISADTYSYMYSASGSTTTGSGSLTTTGDAWGTLNMPGSKTYPNTLRLKVQITETAAITGTTSYNYTVNAFSYVYISSASKFSILAININTFTAQSGTVTNVGYDKSVEVGDVLFSGIKENVNAGNFNLYPNPASNTANLWFVLIDNESYEMTITNALGQVVRNKSYNDLKPGPYNLEVDLKGLQSGIYYVKLKGRNQEGVKKLVIE